MAGNACVLKHVSNVPYVRWKSPDLLREAGLPDNIFRTLLIDSAQVTEWRSLLPYAGGSRWTVDKCQLVARRVGRRRAWR